MACSGISRRDDSRQGLGSGLVGVLTLLLHVFSTCALVQLFPVSIYGRNLDEQSARSTVHRQNPDASQDRALAPDLENRMYQTSVVALVKLSSHQRYRESPGSVDRLQIAAGCGDGDADMRVWAQRS